MFETIDLKGDLELIVSKLEQNSQYAKELQKQIQELKMQADAEEIEATMPTSSCPTSPEQESKPSSREEEMDAYIEEYRKIDGDDVESLKALLPDPDSYEYEDIILRLQAESLKEIKEMTEISELEEEPLKDAIEFIENEKKKIRMLRQLLETEEESSIGEKEENIIVLVPNEGGRIRIFDEIEHIPSDFYEEIYELIQSIINGSFKRRKRFNTSTNVALGGVSEVRGFKGRILFQRLNHNTYAIFSAFIKKTTNDRGYQEMMKNRVGEYRKVESKIKECIQKPEFMELNEEYVKELWNILDKGEDEKTLRKGMESC